MKMTILKAIRITTIVTITIIFETSPAYAGDETEESSLSDEELMRLAERELAEIKGEAISKEDGKHSILMQSAFKHAERLLKRYPLDSYHILNLGLGAAPVDAALRALMGSDASMKSNYFTTMPVRNLIYLEKLSKEMQTKVLDRIVPPDSVIGPRILVINRVLDEGRTMRVFVPILLEYLKSRYPFTQDIELLFYTGRSPKSLQLRDTFDLLKHRNYASVVKNVPYMKSIYGRKPPKEYAAIEPFNLGEIEEDPEGFTFKANPEFNGGLDYAKKHFSSMEQSSANKFHKLMDDAKYRLIGAQIEMEVALEAAHARDNPEPIVDYDIQERALEHATTMLQTYPPDKYYIVNLGVPATLTSAMFRGLFNGPVPEYYWEISVEQIRNLSKMSEDDKRLFFDTVLPTDEELAGRQIVIHRTSWEGRSSKEFIPELTSYLENYRPDILANYYYVYFDPQALPSLKEIFSHPVFVDGQIVLDKRYGERINIGQKLSDFTENTLHTPESAISTEEYPFEDNPKREILDEELRQQIFASGGSYVSRARSIANRCEKMFEAYDE